MLDTNNLDGSGQADEKKPLFTNNSNNVTLSASPKPTMGFPESKKNNVKFAIHQIDRPIERSTVKNGANGGRNT